MNRVHCMPQDQKPYARFEGGTIILEQVREHLKPPGFFLWHQGKWRCRAVDYRRIDVWLQHQQIDDQVGEWQSCDFKLYSDWQPHGYQLEALQAWSAAHHWGSVVLPTGAGKTVLALQAIAQTSVSTLVVVPTIDLLHQWYTRLRNAFNQAIGTWYGLEKQLETITVTTYPSAWAHAETLGNRFKLIIFDEIHHLPAPSWHELALMSAAPYRLGLTATYPDNTAFKFHSKAHTQFSDPVALLKELVGPVVYRKHIDELTGAQLATYRTQRIRVTLNQTEQQAYEAAYAIYIGYIRETRIRDRHGPGWWHEFTRRSAYEAQARRAKVAELKWKEIIYQAQNKLVVLDQLLTEHRQQLMLIFTAHNRFAYHIARTHLLPVITHQTKAAERKAILEQFRNGGYRAIVTTKVLNEGIDVPEAKIAVILGGSANDREYIQRLGRVLRKQGNAQAILYEVIVRNTADEGIAQRRQPRF